jgi:hypothetical protein
MLFPSLKHVEVSFHGADNRNQIVDISDLPKIIPQGGSDHYYCIFRYEHTLVNHVESSPKRSVAGHTLPGYADYIYFDIDNKEDLGKAKEWTLQLLDNLHALGIEDEKIIVSFSGSKGFHVVVPSSLFGMEPDPENYRHMKVLAKQIAGDVQLDTSIYDRNRLFRLRNTKNSKTGLFKVDLEPAMLMCSIEDVMDFASEPREKKSVINNFPVRPELKALWEKAKAKPERPRVMSGRCNADIPQYNKVCIHKMLQGVPDGMIHNSAFRLAVHFAKVGYPANVVLKLLEGWGPVNEVPAEEDFQRMVEDAMTGQYDFGCNDDILRHFCDPCCKFHKKEPVADTSRLLTLEEMYKRYEQYIARLDQLRFKTGFPELDEVIRGVAPGETMMITAYSGLFKSAWLQNLLLGGAKRSGLYHPFFSLEMPATKVFERTSQIVSEDYSFNIERAFRENDEYFKQALVRRLMADNADKMIVCEEPGLTIEKVGTYITAIRKKFGEIGAVGIDYLGLMKAEGMTGEYERISYIAENSKGLAKEHSIPLIILVQVSREFAGKEVEKSSGKGSGAIEASADYQLGFWKDEDGELLMKLTKNRNGEEGVTYKVNIDKSFLKFRSLERYEGKRRKPRGSSCPVF